MIKSFYLLLVVVLLGSCYYDNREELYPGQGCDTANVKYSTFIKPMMDAKCVGCHNDGNPSGGVKLNTYAGVQAVALSGQLYGVLTGIPPYASVMMPPGGPKWPECDINKVKSWINKGAPNN